MKNRPLYLRIWMLLIGVTLAVSLIVIIILPNTLHSFFSRDTYLTIENAQQAVLTKNWNGELNTPAERDQARQDIRSVNHIVLLPDGRSVPQTVLEPYMRLFQSEAAKQTREEQQYSHQAQGKTIYYIIRKVNVAGKNVSLLSYMWGDYQQQLVRTLFRKLMFVNIIVLLLSWIPAIWLAKLISRPLVLMEKHVRRIAARDWHEPLLLKRDDEIGRLAESIEWMRDRLARQDEAQQTLLQHISHELKTPVMVIRSYAQSVQDGIYPKGDLQGTMQVIEEESGRLDKRIRDLLYLTKLDHLSVQHPDREPIDLQDLLEKTVEKLRWRRTELEWLLDVEPTAFQGDPEQWAVVCENLLDNQIRYASSRIEIQASAGETASPSCILLRIWNDGPPIPPNMLESLFQKFRKGDKGQFGLGLAIVERIVKLHQAEIWAANENGGAAFYIKIRTSR